MAIAMCEESLELGAGDVAELLSEGFEAWYEVAEARPGAVDVRVIPITRALIPVPSAALVGMSKAEAEISV